jgi:hypothetical protein
MPSVLRLKLALTSIWRSKHASDRLRLVRRTRVSSDEPDRRATVPSTVPTTAGCRGMLSTRVLRQWETFLQRAARRGRSTRTKWMFSPRIWSRKAGSSLLEVRSLSSTISYSLTAALTLRCLGTAPVSEHVDAENGPRTHRRAMSAGTEQVDAEPAATESSADGGEGQSTLMAASQYISNYIPVLFGELSSDRLLKLF